MMSNYLLSHTVMTDTRLAVEENGHILLSQETHFDLTADTPALVALLQAVKADKAVRHTFTDEDWVFEYEPYEGLRHDAFCITRRATGRTIGMAVSTMNKLLDALTGKTDRLVEETP